MSSRSITEQIRRNAVALISLVVAVTSLGYNTWRNEASEGNRNQRWASFEVLLELGELRQLMERAAVVSGGGAIGLRHLPLGE